MKTNLDSEWEATFRQRLDEYYSWPSLYTFKFILPKEQADNLKNLFPFRTSIDKLSKNHNFISMTYQMMMPSADGVIKVYKEAAQIEGVIAL